MATKKQARPFQREVLRLMMEGENIILQAPTGAGKTDAALVPFIQNLESEGDTLPYTCIYATPMRVLSTQFLAKYGERMSRLDKQHGTKLVEPYERLGHPPVSIQTGEQQADPQFESILTFCTIDQLLASFLGVPYSLDGRQANINVAAILSSYLVLDEFHLYPLLRGNESCFGARTTTLSLLRLLKSTSRFILMTATFSTELLIILKNMLNAQVVSVTDEDLRLISAGRERTFVVWQDGMSAESILSAHHQCSLVVCNTVLRSQSMYWQIKDEATRRGIKVVLLHSRLTAQDRAARSAEVMHELGPAPQEWPDEERYGWQDGVYHGKNIIVIATQVVEVGLDISVQTLHTELAPANSLIQRAGRCARFSQQHGTVIVYPLLDAAGNPLSHRPYPPSLCECTWQALQQMPDTVVGFREEQVLLDAVHTKEDRELLARYDSGQGHGQISERIFLSLNEHKRNVTSSLIRDIAQVHVLVHDNPNEEITEKPWLWQSFALHPNSLAGRWQALQNRAAELHLDWICKRAKAVPAGDDEADSNQKTRYTWKDIPASGNFSMIAQALREALMVVLPTQLATYHDELGFVLLDGQLPIESTSYQSTPGEGKEKRPGFFLKHRSYEEHIAGLIEAYDRNIHRNMCYIMRRLEELLELPSESIDHAIRLAIACHDLGKLGTGWQEWAWNWQKRLFEAEGYPSLPTQPYFFAKTDFDSQSPVHRDLRDKMKIKRPPHHACESVAIGQKLLRESIYALAGKEKGKVLVRAVYGAIAHHHTTDAHIYNSIQLKDGAIQAIEEALQFTRQAIWNYNLSHLNLLLIEGGDLMPTNRPAPLTIPKQGQMHELETWLYFVIARALRLADQRAERY